MPALLVETAFQDVRFAVRSLARRPVFAGVVIATLALGIATATAMFTLVDDIVLRPLPFRQPDRLVEVVQSFPEKKLDRWTLSQQNTATYLGLTSFESFAAHARTGLTLDVNGTADRVIAEVVTGDFFTLLGVHPLLGRVIGRDDDHTGGDAVVVLSYDFWQSRFAGSPSALGQRMDLSGQPRRIVGIMPKEFAFPKPDVEVYIPLGLDPTRAHPNFLTGLGRLRGGVSADQASHEATLALWNWARSSPDVLSGTPPERTRLHVVVTPLRTAIAGSVARPLLVLQAGVLLILLIAIANVVTLLGTRRLGRRHEVAVRAALGASRGRIIGQTLTEGFVLAVLGGALGGVAAYGLVRTFTHSGLASLPRMEEIGVDWRVMLFAAAASVVSGILFGLVPSLSSEPGALGGVLAGQKSSASRGARVTNKLLIAGQVALSFVLLIGAGLMLKSFRRLVTTDLGFDARHVMAFTMPLPPQRYAMANKPRSYVFVDEAVRATSSLRGVRNAAVMFPAMYVNDVNSDGFIVEGQTVAPNAPSELTLQYSVSPGLFRTLDIPMLAGRDFTAADRDNAPSVVIVDRALVSRYWSPSDAIGKRIRMTGDTAWRTIVGVVGSIRDEGVADAPRAHTYFPYAQYGGSRPTLVVRSDDEQAAVVRAVRQRIATVDAGVPIDNPHAVTAAIASSLATQRMMELLLSGFALLAVLLAACGLYGVMSLYVASRRREFGIRAAIGARPAALARVVVGEGLTLVLAGLGTGLLVSLGAGAALRSLLYEVTPTDISVYVGVAGVILAVAAVACYLPARRAGHSDPLVALRAE
ncbi:MAG TPA: ABC transporter permease [Gemmatimonadaceae bacterium]|nr:ABC transporter permease [Gemmatimonadaceae bacterium]